MDLVGGVADLDDFSACAVGGPDDLVGLFVDNFFFGCEADDPMNAVAFEPDRWPYGARLHACYGSDISHFDVPVMAKRGT